MELRIVHMKRFSRSQSVSKIDSLIIYVEMTNDDSADLHWDIEFQWTAWIFYPPRNQNHVPGGETRAAIRQRDFELFALNFWEIFHDLVLRDVVKLICASGKPV